ncbi:MAG: tRNA (adenosine(37)-N6)-threonylcarbamoyltransferase complex ATPase subunit type 1 TsaE [Burkholderiaceae bacterium]|nr:tRNA (adenosine(37)-N6)-threonylcarbamoyltransferase complex ATPase subunit type 1 TsaE [Burkholderiaceae bacterium]
MQPPIPRIELLLTDEAASVALAGAIAPHFRPGFVLYLSGDLGTGKTCLARAVLHALGHRGRVPSPTFNLVQSYNLSSFQLYHFDLYRFSSPEQWRDAGFDEHLGGDDAAIVEWPELGAGLLPPPDVWLRLAIGAPGGEEEERVVVASAGTEWGRQCLIGIVDAIRLGLLAGVSLQGDWLPPVL